MSKIKLNYVGVVIDQNIANNIRSSIDLIIKDSKDISVVNSETGIQSEHEFSIISNSPVGKVLTCNQENSVIHELFGLACSLVDRRINFAKISKSFLDISKEEQEEPNEIEINHKGESNSAAFVTRIKLYPYATAKLITTCTINEKDIINVTNLLYSRSMFTKKISDVKFNNIKSSLDAYQQSIESIDMINRYENLYIAYEKAINGDLSDRNGAKFDSFASAYTGISSFNLKDLRDLNNGLKHTFKNQSDYNEFLILLSKINFHIINLKYITNIALLKRINEL